MSRNAFEWDPVEDIQRFRANRNSFVLEEKIAKNVFGTTDNAHPGVKKLYNEPKSYIAGKINLIKTY